MKLYIDAFSYDDYDKVVKFLLAHDVEITHRDKVKMCVGGEITKELIELMKTEVEFEDPISFGPTPLL